MFLYNQMQSSKQSIMQYTWQPAWMLYAGALVFSMLHGFAGLPEEPGGCPVT